MSQQTPHWNPDWEEIPPVPKRTLAAGKQELFFALFIALWGMLLCNCVRYGGFNLGFSIGAAGCILCTFFYLLSRGYRPSVYSGLLLILSLVIAAAFARTDDIFVKIVMLGFLGVSVNLGFTLMAGKQLRDPGRFSSLWDAPRAVFTLGIGKSADAVRGLLQAFRGQGTAAQKSGAFLLGLCLAIPLLAIMLPLLIRADAAFDGLIALLPEFRFGELVFTLISGVILGCILYSRGAALCRGEKEEPIPTAKKGIAPITVNTVLGAVCLMYLLYLVSQLAYFSGGFSGILPEGYSTAEYARRGFFEMAWLCAMNLGIVALCLRLVRKEIKAPLSTRLFCLFLCLVTVFLVATASGKMFLYIGSYGLTRLRVLTQVIMFFLAITTILVAVSLFIPRLPYMKGVILAALILGAAVIWTDVDTLVAKYNVDAYLSGKLETVDVRYIALSGKGAVPHLDRLHREAPESAIRTAAQDYLKLTQKERDADFRNWNYVNHIAAHYYKK